jgi:uncharacterized membrane protein
LVRLIGVRELVSGLGILSRPRPAEWVMARVGGDLMDLGLLGRAYRSDQADRPRVAAATTAVAGVLVTDILVSGQLSRAPARRPTSSLARQSGVHLQQAITVRQPRERVFAFWQDFTNLLRFMSHLESVEVTGEGRSHWRAKAPAGRTVEWDAEIVELEPNTLIGWRSLPGADVDNWGRVRFQAAPADRGTEVSVELHYDAPGGPFGRLVAKLFGEEPSQQVAADLRRFKQVLEAGEVIVSDATLHGSGLKQHPAQPPATAESNRRG